MNERIKELSKQAGCYYDGMGYGEGNIEKFAELIVRECAEICLEANDHKNILRYFGVEE
jgi:hypothetical protein